MLDIEDEDFLQPPSRRAPNLKNYKRNYQDDFFAELLRRGKKIYNNNIKSKMSLYDDNFSSSYDDFVDVEPLIELQEPQLNSGFTPRNTNLTSETPPWHSLRMFRIIVFGVAFVFISILVITLVSSRHGHNDIVLSTNSSHILLKDHWGLPSSYIMVDFGSPVNSKHQHFFHVEMQCVSKFQPLMWLPVGSHALFQIPLHAPAGNCTVVLLTDDVVHMKTWILVGNITVKDNAASFISTKIEHFDTFYGKSTDHINRIISKKYNNEYGAAVTNISHASILKSLISKVNIGSVLRFAASSEKKERALALFLDANPILFTPNAMEELNSLDFEDVNSKSVTSFKWVNTSCKRIESRMEKLHVRKQRLHEEYKKLVFLYKNGLFPIDLPEYWLSSLHNLSHLSYMHEAFHLKELFRNCIKTAYHIDSSTFMVMFNQSLYTTTILRSNISEPFELISQFRSVILKDVLSGDDEIASSLYAASTLSNETFSTINAILPKFLHLASLTLPTKELTRNTLSITSNYISADSLLYSDSNISCSLGLPDRSLFYSLTCKPVTTTTLTDVFEISFSFKITYTFLSFREHSITHYVTLTEQGRPIPDIKEPDKSIPGIGDLHYCGDNLKLCHINAHCRKKHGNFDCYCKSGYSGDGVWMCDNLNECANGNNRCSGHASCVDTIGSYMCSCKEGWKGNGVDCEDIDECEQRTNVCGYNTLCENSLGSYYCYCKSGYRKLTSGICVDINECSERSDECEYTAICVNTSGSYSCECKQGFVKKDNICTDIDECNENSHNCKDDSSCINIPGSFRCS